MHGYLSRLMNSENNNPVNSFDQASVTYDSDFTHSGTGMLQRERVYKFLSDELSTQIYNILEINCGTGEDAIWLAKRGHRVFATDRSAGMIERSKIKLGQEKPDLPAAFYVYPFDGLKDHFQQGQFDLIFSDFGGLNCVDSAALEKLSADFSWLLKPGGRFIAVIMGRKCIWEIFYFLIKGKLSSAFRRQTKQAVLAKVGNHFQQTYYFSPDEMQSLTAGEFQMTELKPIGFALPPSYLDPFFKNKPRWLSLLYKLEKKCTMPWLADFADHYFIVLNKK